MYHDVYHNTASESGFQNIGAIPYKLKSADFEQQIDKIANYCESSFTDKTQIALTFDDGGESFHSIIAPILEKNGFKGYFFITTSLIGTPGFLSKDQIIDLHLRGHIIGTHSHTHPKNISELAVVDLGKEWSFSVEILNKILSAKIKTASIPGGFYSEQSRIALKQNGIEMIFTSFPTNKIIHKSNDQYIIGRFAIKAGTNNDNFVKLIKNYHMIRFCKYIQWMGLALTRLVLGNDYYRIREILIKKLN